MTVGGCGDRRTPQESAQLTQSAGMCRHLARSVAKTSACVESHPVKWRQREMKPRRGRRHSVVPGADTQRRNYAHIYPVIRIHMSLRGAQMSAVLPENITSLLCSHEKARLRQVKFTDTREISAHSPGAAPAPRFGHQVGQTGVCQRCVDSEVVSHSRAQAAEITLPSSDY